MADDSEKGKWSKCYREKRIRYNLCQDNIMKTIEASKAYSYQFSIKAVGVPIDIFTVYDAILAGGQTRLKLQWMYGILAHLEPL